MAALQAWNGGVIIISHDERFITTVAKEVDDQYPLPYSVPTHICSFQLWVCADGAVTKFKGDVQAYKVRCTRPKLGSNSDTCSYHFQSLIVNSIKARP